jgi:hypothetical protein
MTRLTDTQLMVLSKAVAREDGVGVVPPRMNKAAAAKVGSSLIARRLMREVRAKPGMPVWREDEQGRRISLIITRAGRDAIGVVDDRGEAEPPAGPKRADVRDNSRRRIAEARFPTSQLSLPPVAGQDDHRPRVLLGLNRRLERLHQGDGELD